MKRNKGFTLVEGIIVMAVLGTVLLFFWNILESSSKDSYTITEKTQVQSSVTSLMNMVQQDIQEGKIYNISESERGIIGVYGNTYKFADIVYEFDLNKRLVTRTQDGVASVYNDIASFSMETVTGEKYGAKVKIIGGKKALSEEVDKSRYSLNATYYTRNTR